jgi:biopolymer transport protein ExbB
MSIRGTRSRRIPWLLLAMVAWTAWILGPATWLPATRAAGQEKGKEAADKGAAKAAEKKAEPAAAPAAEEAKSAAASEGQRREQISPLRWFIDASGIVGLFILGLSVYFVATIGRLFWELRIPVAVPPEIAGRCQDLLAQRNFKGIFDVVKGDDSLFSRLLSHGIAELPTAWPRPGT